MGHCDFQSMVIANIIFTKRKAKCKQLKPNSNGILIKVCRLISISFAHRANRDIEKLKLSYIANLFNGDIEARDVFRSNVNFDCAPWASYSKETNEEEVEKKTH